MNPSSDGSPTPDLVLAVAGLDGNEASSLLIRWEHVIDWAALPSRVELIDGARLFFEKRRRSARVEQANGGVMVIDLGRRDRMRSLDAILTPDLVRHDGPVVDVALVAPYGGGRAEVAVRDPLSPKIKRATGSVPLGAYATSRLVDAAGAPQVIAFGDLSSVSGFGTFLMDGGTSYAHLHTASGLGCFYDAGRTTFMRAVTEATVDQARAEGFAPVDTKAGVIGVVFDCGAPGDYLSLSSYDAVTGGIVGIVVDLRRPPVRDGAIVDPLA